METYSEMKLGIAQRGLTEEQSAFVEFVIDSVAHKRPGIVIVNSPGGTGKSFVVALLVRLLGSQMFVVAPTHKAKSILNNQLRSNKADTFHRFFGAKSEYTDGGKLVFRFPNKLEPAASLHGRHQRASPYARKSCSESSDQDTEDTSLYDEYGEPLQQDSKHEFNAKDFGVLVADECSMISTDILEQFEKRQNVSAGLTVFMGDSAQLPPVGEDYSPVFTKSFHQFGFTKNMRAKNKDILQLTQFFRQPFNEASVTATFGHPQQLETSLLEICGLDKWHRSRCVYLTFTNQKKNLVNEEIRRQIYAQKRQAGKKIARFEEGERLYFSGYRDLSLEVLYTKHGLDGFASSAKDVMSGGDWSTSTHQCRSIMLDKKKNIPMFPDCQLALLTLHMNQCLNVNNEVFYSSDELEVTSTETLDMKFHFMPETLSFLKFRFTKVDRSAHQKSSLDESLGESKLDSASPASERKSGTEPSPSQVPTKEFVWLAPSAESDKVSMDKFFASWAKRIRSLRQSVPNLHPRVADPSLLKGLSGVRSNSKLPISSDSDFRQQIRNEWHNYWFLRKLLMPDLEYTYAMTIHKAQGSQWPVVYVDIPRLYKCKDGRQLIYTAVSRAQERVIFTN